MDNILDHVVVQGQRYDIVSPTAFGDNIETIGSACINPDGYAQGSTFLARLGNEQFYYEATAAITQGSAISEGTNCKKTTVAGREAELASEIETLDENLTSEIQTLKNEVEARAQLGAHNLLPNNATSQVLNGVSYTVNSDGTVTVSSDGTNSDSYIVLNTRIQDCLENNKKYVLTGCPSNGSMDTFYMTCRYFNYDTGNGLVIDFETNPTAYTAGDINVLINVKANTTCNVTFKPMIRLASDSDPTYQPYAMTNRELTTMATRIRRGRGVIGAVIQDVYCAFGTPFANVPTVVASLDGDKTVVSANVKSFSVKDVTANGFTISINRSANTDNIYFSYIATDLGTVSDY